MQATECVMTIEDSPITICAADRKIALQRIPFCFSQQLQTDHQRQAAHRLYNYTRTVEIAPGKAHA